MSSYVAAGIAGSISRPVHIRGCVNFGKISFDGISSRARSTAGGIVGSMMTPKSQDAGAYVSRCINHGEIYAGSGGNKYDKTNRNAIHAGGVVAFAEIREGLRASVKDNFNDGKVTCDGGRKGSIAGAANGVSVSGSPCDDWAQTLNQPAQDGSNVSGTVKTLDGQPLEGIWVTDGIQYSCLVPEPLRHCGRFLPDDFRPGQDPLHLYEHPRRRPSRFA